MTTCPPTGQSACCGQGVLCAASKHAIRLKGVEETVSLYHLVEWLDVIESAPNPFVWRGGITKADDFFDRDNEQGTLRTYVHGRQNCQIVGSRRIGKTSLLLHIESTASKWEDACVVAYLDLRDPRCFTLSGWLTRARRQFGWSTTPTNLAEFTNCVDDMRSARRRPVLCLDEAEDDMRAHLPARW